MNADRRCFVGKLATAGAGFVAATAIVGQQEAVAADIEVLPGNWAEVLPNRNYRANANIFVAATVFHRNGDFRAAIAGFVNGQRRAAACAGWSPASGMSANSFLMPVLNGQVFQVDITDDFTHNHGVGWDVDILVSGPVTQV